MVCRRPLLRIPRAMSTEQLRVLYASWPDEEFLVAEIWMGEAYLGDVRRDREDNLLVSLRPSGGNLEGIPLEQFESALVAINERLASGEGRE